MDSNYGTGHRKDATARVWLTPGTGQIIVNGKPVEVHLPRQSLVQLVNQPFVATETAGKFDVRAFAKGGGVAGQAGALRHGIAKALVERDEEMRSPLRRAGYLTRDPRVKERKKPGRHSARRGKQFSKR
ncbi:MAG TPA: 30S ribosomal protein S9 [Armatimonadota bacterium]|nr:30S ribosomal protein S9 [Armatimonadota bacterium]